MNRGPRGRPTSGRGRAAGWGAVVAICCGIPTASAAEGSLGVLFVDATGTEEAGMGRAAAALGVADDAAVSYVLTPAPPAFWSTAPWTTCPDPASRLDIPAVLQSARAQLATLAADEALAALESAARLLPCADAPIARLDLLSLFELLGEAGQAAGSEGNARFAYEALLAVDPAHTLSSPPGTGYEVLFNEVRARFASQTQASVGIHHLGAADAVFWDGEAIPATLGVPRRALPGRHLLQWRDGEGVRGAFVEVAAGGAALAIVSVSALSDLLRLGPANAGRRASIEPLVSQWAEKAGLPAIAILADRQATDGYVVRGGRAEAFSAASVGVGRTLHPERLRLLVGVGYANLQATHYGDVTASFEPRLIGPLHLRVEADLALSQPLDGRVAGYEDQGKIAVLPGVGAGALVRSMRGLIQPFGSLTFGAWIGARDAAASARLDAALDSAVGDPVLSENDANKLAARHAVDLRSWLDGGVDLVPAAGPVVVRVGAGIGMGLALRPDAGVGFQVRVGAAVGLRLGRVVPRVEGVR